MAEGKTIHLHSVAETQSFAQRMAEGMNPGMVIALTGNLGSGKTTFTQGFAAGMGISETVGSPTFKLVSEYRGDRLTLYHVDCYRLQDSADFLNIGGEDWINPYQGITVIEWAERIEALLPADTVRLHFTRLVDQPEGRTVTIQGWKP